MTTKIENLEQQITALKEQLAKARHEATPQDVKDYTFAGLEGPISLSALFGDKTDLFIVHNMGKGCPYCTLWADGLNGLLCHFEERAAFVVVSPNEPEIQKQFADSRGWKFRMVSDQTKEFTSDMGFWNEIDGWWPGVSGFKRDGDAIVRTGKTFFGPGDDFCAIWPMMDLIGGDGGWEPKI